MASIRKALTLSEHVLGGVCVLVLGGMVALAVAAVFFRFVVNSSLAFPDEVVRYLFVWTVFLGSADRVAAEHACGRRDGGRLAAGARATCTC